MTNSEVRLTELSRIVSHALRHEPWLYELELDADGWVEVDQLLRSLREKGGLWAQIQRNHIERMIISSEKERHELNGGRIRALYGHSVPDRLQRTPSPPPPVLYHGTSPDVRETILSEGLCPMSRQYVHLSIDVETAFSVGQRKHKTPILLCISATVANQKGITFYKGNDKVWLADLVPSTFIQEGKWQT